MKTCKDCVANLFSRCTDYCRPERDGLIAEARQRAEQQGHALGEFVKVERYAIWRATCVRCGQSVAVALDPAPGELDISGEALLSPCPQSEVE
jgi:hypothetical protein